MLSDIFSPTKNNGAEHGFAQVERYAPSTKIPYKQDLISVLKHENRLMLAAIKLILERIKQNDVVTVRKLMQELKNAIIERYIKESVLLYTYIKALYKDDEEKQQLLQELKQEWSGVHAMMMHFLNCYLNKDLIAVDMLPLGKELMVITEVVMNRIRHEEYKLYPLYLPPPV